MLSGLNLNSRIVNQLDKSNSSSIESLRKHAYSNILKILPPKNENFQIKNSDIFMFLLKT